MEETALAFRQTAQRAACFLWPAGRTGLICGPSVKDDELWGGGKIYLFVLISSDSLSWGWAGWNPAADIRPERRQHATSAG